MIAPIQLASTTSPISIIFETAQSYVLIIIPDQEQEILNINQEIINNKNTDNSNNRDYTNKNIIISFTIRNP
jgi:hypothetical protein